MRVVPQIKIVFVASWYPIAWASKREHGLRMTLLTHSSILIIALLFKDGVIENPRN